MFKTVPTYLVATAGPVGVTMCTVCGRRTLSPEMPDEAMDLVLQTLQPLVNRETLTPEEWQVASDALASIRTEAGTGEPDELLRRLAVSQDDNTRADSSVPLQQPVDRVHTRRLAKHTGQ